MQVDVKTHESKAVATEAQQVFSTIHEKLGLADLGSGNQLSVQALLNLAEQETLPTPNDNAAMLVLLNNVTDILHNIIWTDLQAAKDTEHADMIQYSATLVPDCLNEETTQHSSAKTDMELARTNHNACRGEEVTAWDNCLHATTGKCTIAVNDASSIVSTGIAFCTKPSVCEANVVDCGVLGDTDASTTSNIETWESWFTAGKTAASANSGLLTTTKIQDCIDARKALTDKTAACKTLQQTFENKFCSYKDAIITMCNARSECVDQHTGTYNTNKPNWIAASTKRAQQAAIVDHMLCLLEKLKVGDTDISSCYSNGTDTNYYASSWSNVMVDPTPPANCSTTTEIGAVWPKHPDDATWAAHANSEYANLNTNTPHDDGADDTGLVTCAAWTAP